MVRAALRGKKIGQGPHLLAAYIPAASVVTASLLSALPLMSASGWYPDLAFMTLIAWRLLRSDAFPAWWAAPLGLANDIITGMPIGFSVSLWAASILFLDIVDRRTMWRDYWIEWGLAGVLLIAHEAAEWRVAAAMGAALPFRVIIEPVVIAILAFPVIAWGVSRIDSWRLGR